MAQESARWVAVSQWAGVGSLRWTNVPPRLREFGCDWARLGNGKWHVVNGIVWERFTARHQADEINELWPDADYQP